MQRVHLSPYWPINSLYTLRSNQLPAPNFFSLSFPLSSEERDKDGSLMMSIQKTIKNKMQSAKVMAVMMPDNDFLPSDYKGGIQSAADILMLDEMLRKTSCHVLFVDDLMDAGAWVQVERTSDTGAFLIKLIRIPLVPFQIPQKSIKFLLRPNKSRKTGEPFYDCIQLRSKNDKSAKPHIDDMEIIHTLSKYADLLKLLDKDSVYNCLVNTRYEMGTCIPSCKKSQVIFYDEIPRKIIENTYNPPSMKRGATRGSRIPMVTSIMVDKGAINAIPQAPIGEASHLSQIDSELLSTLRRSP